MGYSKYVGRVGALAVALGITALAAPVVGHADSSSGESSVGHSSAQRGSAGERSKPAGRTARVADRNSRTANTLGQLPAPAAAAQDGTDAQPTFAQKSLAGKELPNAPAKPAPEPVVSTGSLERQLAVVDRHPTEEAITGASVQLATTQAIAPAFALAAPGDIISDLSSLLVNALAGLRNFFYATFARPSLVAREQQYAIDAGTSISAKFDASAPFPGEQLVYHVNAIGAPGGPEHGTVHVSGDTFTYTPNEGFTGVDSFTYVVDDESLFDPHIHLLGALNSPFGVFGTSFGGGHRSSSTVTLFVGADGIPERITNDLTVATYNIADLPFPLNFALNDETSLPRFTGTGEISRRFNQLHQTADGRVVGFDYVNVQEDFAWHWVLIQNTMFADATPPQVPDWLWPIGVPYIAGLNSLSSYQIDNLQHTTFNKCGSFNCLTPKGFTYNQIQIPGGERIDMYNLHTDSGEGRATNDQILQLSDYIQRNSAGNAVIVTGDWNQLYSEQGEVLTEFAAANGLTDAWVLQEYNGVAPTDADTCPNANKCEQLDKIFFRSSAETIPGDAESRAVILELLRNSDTDDYVGYQNFGLEFEESDGVPLSDHRPVGATLRYTTRNNFAD